MKVTIIIIYAGQEVKFTNLEFEDTDTWNEVYSDFMGKFDIMAINEATGEELE